MRKHLIISALGMLLLASCSETKYVAEGELLLDKVKVKLKAAAWEVARA